jgi:hypothetical protein
MRNAGAISSPVRSTSQVATSGDKPPNRPNRARNSYVNSTKRHRSITTLFIGSSSFPCGLNFWVFVSFTLVGTNPLVPILGRTLIIGTALRKRDSERHSNVAQQHTRLPRF